MPKLIDNPRYNVVSARLSDEEKQLLDEARGRIAQSDFARTAILEKIERGQTALTCGQAINQVD